MGNCFDNFYTLPLFQSNIQSNDSVSLKKFRPSNDEQLVSVTFLFWPFLPMELCLKEKENVFDVFEQKKKRKNYFKKGVRNCFVQLSQKIGHSY